MMRNALLAFANRVHFVEDRATVVERAVEELRRATGAPWVAAYTPVDEGCVTLAAMAGDITIGAPDEIDQDDPALVELRAARSLLDGPADSVLAGALLLPFVVAGRITGLLVVAPPADRFSSAERELLASVARAVGLAFEVLAVRALRREATYWRGRAESAQRELEAVRGPRVAPTPMRVGSDLL